MKAKESKYYPWVFILMAALLSAGANMVASPIFLFFYNIPLLGLYSFFQHSDSRQFRGLDMPILVSIAAFLLYAPEVYNVAYDEPIASKAMWASILPLGLVIPFLLYRFFQQVASNRIGLYTLIVFWLCVEYIAYEYRFEYWPTLGLHGALPSQWIKWGKHTGALGVSAWLLVANILLFSAFFDKDGVYWVRPNWLAFIAASIVVVMPIAVSWSWPEGWVSRQVFYAVANTAPIAAPDNGWQAAYHDNGEFFGRTAIWLSVLLMAYAVVKSKIN